jgi:phosphatidylinositol alpha-1,6-mannosyltransferase
MAAAYFAGTGGAFRRVVAEVAPDILVAGNSYPCGWLWLRLPDKYLRVNYIHGEEMTMDLEYGPLARWFKRRQLRSLRTADLNIAVSRYSADQVVRLAGAPPERVVTLPNPVDTARFQPPRDRKALRQSLGWSGRSVILTIARLVPRKGLDQALRALAEARKLPKDWLYVIGGRGPVEAELRALADRLGLSERVRFLGFVPDEDLAALYGAADVFLQPNRTVDGDTEGFGIVFLEANACGTPVIGGIAGGTADAIEEGVSGFRVDGDSVAEIRAALERILGDDALRRRMARAGLERACRDFTVGACARRFEDILAAAWERKFGARRA